MSFGEYTNKNKEKSKKSTKTKNIITDKCKSGYDENKSSELHSECYTNNDTTYYKELIKIFLSELLPKGIP
jgi:hypothetical protein